MVWTDLPASWDHCPKLPRTRKWHVETRRLWREMWRRPQASQWDQTGLSLRAYIALLDDIHKGDTRYESVAAELRQIENLHGLSAKAMLQLRWRLPDPAEPQPSDPVADGRPVPRTVTTYGTVTEERKRRVWAKLHADAEARS